MLILRSVFVDGPYGPVRCFNARTNQTLGYFMEIEVPPMSDFSLCENPEYAIATVIATPSAKVVFGLKKEDGVWVDYHPEASVDPLEALRAANIEFAIIPQIGGRSLVVKEEDVEKIKAAMPRWPRSLHHRIEEHQTVPEIEFEEFKGVMVTDPLGILPDHVF